MRSNNALQPTPCRRCAAPWLPSLRSARLSAGVRHASALSAIFVQLMNEVDMALTKSIITRSDKVMSGAVVLAGTRVPVQTLLDYLEEGDTLDHFLDDFPTVSRRHAVAVLELAKESVLAHADSA